MVGLFNSLRVCADTHRVPEEILELSRPTGRASAIAPFNAHAPRATSSWAALTPGAQRLAEHLSDSLAGRAVVLNGRELHGMSTDLDHLIVGPTGIWAVDATTDSGNIECRDRGSWTKANDRLYVGGRNRTHLVSEMTTAIAAVRRLLEPAGYGGSPVHGAICFSSATWPPLCRSFQLDGVWVSDTAALVDLVLASHSFSDEAIDAVSEALRGRVTPA
jgi:Nuclease-related domain